MRTVFCLFLTLLMAGGTLAQNELLGDHFDKAQHLRLSNPGIPDGRQGGETMTDAFPIPSLPFEDSGNTSDNLDDFDAVCPYSGSTSPDVVYALPLSADIQYLSVDLCGSGYDTKVYILDSSGEVIACNDDFYFPGDPCGTYVSKIEEAVLAGGEAYYVVVDGYGGDYGDYSLTVQEYEAPPPCILECSGLQEAEPPLHDGYVDLWNSGCNDETGVYPFYHIGGSCSPVDLTVCGVSGWYASGTRDTDWYITTVGYSGVVEFYLDAEQETFGFLLGGDLVNCVDVTVYEQITAGPCDPGHMTIQDNPGETLYLWVGPTEYYPPAGFFGHEYDYVIDLEGIVQYPGVTATETISLDKIKTLYR